MDFKTLANPSVLDQPVYEPGKPIEDVARELGLDPKSIIKLASNENPFGPSPKAVQAAMQALLHGELYPDGGCFVLRNKLATKLAFKPDEIIIGNGSNEILELLGHAFLKKGDEVVMGSPAFVVYKLVTRLFGAYAVEVPLKNYTHDLTAMALAVTAKTKMVFVASPNNPTGTVNTEAELLAFIRSLPEHVIVVFDEAYVEYQLKAPDLSVLIREGRKLICLRTFSKIYGLASLRIGYGYAAAECIALLNRCRQPFNVNAIGQSAATAALDDEVFTQQCIKDNTLGLKQLEEGFKQLGLDYVPSVANFILVKVGKGAVIFTALQKRGLIVRPMASYQLPEWIRVSVGTREQNEKLITVLKEELILIS